MKNVDFAEINRVSCIFNSGLGTDVKVDANISANEYCMVIMQMTHSLYDAGCKAFGADVMREGRDTIIADAIERNVVFEDEETMVKNFDKWDEEERTKRLRKALHMDEDGDENYSVYFVAIVNDITDTPIITSREFMSIDEAIKFVNSVTSLDYTYSAHVYKQLYKDGKPSGTPKEVDYE